MTPILAQAAKATGVTVELTREQLGPRLVLQ
jgi:hypothetical protein